MGDDERFEPTPEQRAWLDSLSPERRHLVSEAMHDHWYRMSRLSQKLDKLVDMMLPGAQPGKAHDQLTELALKAEGFRALARLDNKRADELFAAAEEYHVDPAEIRIEVRDPDE